MTNDGWSKSWPNPDEIVLELQNKNGWNTTVNATVVGDLAVHVHIEREEKGWTATHLPTMTSVSKAIPRGVHVKEALIKWCKKVQHPVIPGDPIKVLQITADWLVLSHLKNENFDTDDPVVLGAKERLCAWCLSNKVG